MSIDVDPITPRLDALDSRLSRIEDKLDNHLDRVSKAELEVASTKKDIEWMRGHLRVASVIALGVASALGTLLLRLLFPGK